MSFDSTDMCLLRVLLTSSAYMGNGWVTMCFCVVDATLLMRRLDGDSHLDVTIAFPGF